VLRFFDIAAIIVHPAETGPELVSYVESTLPATRTYEDAETIAYRVNLPARPERWVATPGDRLGQLSYAEGWGVPAGGVIWAQRRLVRLLVPMNGAAQRMSLRAFSLTATSIEVELSRAVFADTIGRQLMD
jgi:hypothetical protein